MPMRLRTDRPRNGLSGVSGTVGGGEQNRGPVAQFSSRVRVMSSVGLKADAMEDSFANRAKRGLLVLANYPHVDVAQTSRPMSRATRRATRRSEHSVSKPIRFSSALFSWIHSVVDRSAYSNSGLPRLRTSPAYAAEAAPARRGLPRRAGLPRRSPDGEGGFIESSNFLAHANWGHEPEPRLPPIQNPKSVHGKLSRVANSCQRGHERGSLPLIRPPATFSPEAGGESLAVRFMETCSLRICARIGIYGAGRAAFGPVQSSRYGPTTRVQMR